MIFVRIVDIETEAMENVCRVIQRPVTIKNPPAHHLMTGRGAVGTNLQTLKDNAKIGLPYETSKYFYSAGINSTASRRF